MFESEFFFFNIANDPLPDLMGVAVRRSLDLEHCHPYFSVKLVHCTWSLTSLCDIVKSVTRDNHIQLLQTSNLFPQNL